MYVLTTTSPNFLTAIRFEFDDDAKEEVVRSSKPGESMLERCCWRHYANHWNEVQGDAITFKIDRPTVLELIWQLRQVDGQLN